MERNKSNGKYVLHYVKFTDQMFLKLHVAFQNVAQQEAPNAP